eukprot:TRINITY_DN750_c0_g1_i1.p1 TRINITY_DN750_c0_g1~~TRINITY_DN750_c0_g1_i1.p1  ORF type:complete len:247 (+),score=62.31 TRINITY_DN750_c0_g1_i1:44-742(+)
MTAFVRFALAPRLFAAPSATAVMCSASSNVSALSPPPPPPPPPHTAAPFSFPETRTAAATTSRRGKPLHLAAEPRVRTNDHYVFVYGTLKRGFANHYLMQRATYVGDFRTHTRFPLVVGGKYNSPYLLDMPSSGSRVKGELYVVDDAVLSDLDHLENVGVNYCRAVTAVTCCADRSFSIDAFVYLKQNNLSELCTKQFLDDYQCRLYVPRHLRNTARSSSSSSSCCSPSSKN